MGRSQGSVRKDRRTKRNSREKTEVHAPKEKRPCIFSGRKRMAVADPIGPFFLLTYLNLLTYSSPSPLRERHARTHILVHFLQVAHTHTLPYTSSMRNHHYMMEEEVFSGSSRKNCFRRRPMHHFSRFSAAETTEEESLFIHALHEEEGGEGGFCNASSSLEEERRNGAVCLLSVSLSLWFSSSFSSNWSRFN